MARVFRDYLVDIHKAASSIDSFVKGMTFDEFQSDEKTVFAVIHGFEIIGEAAKHIPKDFQALHPTIDWIAMAKMRDLLIHHYFGTQYSILWETIENRIPTLLIHMSEILEELE